ncbi:hypothetical protein [Halalkalibacter oceani]|uniref:hypothetical protein n=1 Tax=Halalkalibacter oceani TaxID=1653776 RepID=UPI0033928569
MKAMPYEIKQKLRQYAKAQAKAHRLSREVDEAIRAYGVPIDNLTAVSPPFDGEPYTEALAFINNNEGNIEENILEIEELFLYFVNKKAE